MTELQRHMCELPLLEAGEIAEYLGGTIAYPIANLFKTSQKTKGTIVIQ